MIPAQLQRARAEWQANRRLRIGALLILAILGLQLVLAMSDSRTIRMEQYQRDARLLSRLEEASGESAWPERAKTAEETLAKMRASIPVASSEGLAQAELQAWLGDLAAFAGIGNATVRVETALAVEGQPDLWQVLARLEGDMSESRSAVLMRTLAMALPWYGTERLQVQAGATPRVSLVIRGYFRKGDGKQASTARPAGLPSAEATRLAGAPAVPVRRNPLAPVKTQTPAGEVERPRTPVASPGSWPVRPATRQQQAPPRNSRSAPPPPGGSQPRMRVRQRDADGEGRQPTPSPGSNH